MSWSTFSPPSLNKCKGTNSLYRADSEKECFFPFSSSINYTVFSAGRNVLRLSRGWRTSENDPRFTSIVSGFVLVLTVEFVHTYLMIWRLEHGLSYMRIWRGSSTEKSQWWTITVFYNGNRRVKRMLVVSLQEAICSFPYFLYTARWAFLALLEWCSVHVKRWRKEDWSSLQRVELLYFLDRWRESSLDTSTERGNASCVFRLVCSWAHIKDFK